MAFSLSLNQRFLFAKVEGTPGTMETLTGADFNVLIRNPEITPIVEWADDASKSATGYHDEDEDIAGAQSATIAFTVRLGIGDTISTNPNWVKFMNGCGLKDNGYSSTGVGLWPQAVYDNKTLTIWVYDVSTGADTPNGMVYKFAGCMGNCVVTQDGVGKPMVANFTFTGKCIDVEDVTTLPAGADFDTAHAEKALNQTLAFGGVNQKVSSWSLDLGNEISPLINQGDLTGYDYYQITNRKPRLTANPLAMAVATDDAWGKMISGLTGTQAVFVTGISLTGANIGLKIPRAQRVAAAPGNREGIVSWDSNWRLLGNGWTGSLADSGLPAEATFEILIGARA